MNRDLILPVDFADYESEVEAKGYFTAGLVRRGSRTVPVTFCEPRRLEQDIEADLASGRPFCLVRLIVVERVTAEAMRTAVNAAPEEMFG